MTEREMEVIGRIERLRRNATRYDRSVSIATSFDWVHLLADRQGKSRGYSVAVYRDYLNSDVWKRRRARFLKYNGWCGCGKRAWQVHHKTYERVGNELDSDLEAVCGECHNERHPDRRTE